MPMPMKDLEGVTTPLHYASTDTYQTRNVKMFFSPVTHNEASEWQTCVLFVIIIIILFYLV